MLNEQDSNVSVQGKEQAKRDLYWTAHIGDMLAGSYGGGPTCRRALCMFSDFDASL